MELNIKLDFDGIVDDMFDGAEREEGWAYPTSTFSEAVKKDIIGQVVREIKSQIAPQINDVIRETGAMEVQTFINTELHGIIYRKLRAGEFRSHRGGFRSFDEVIENHLTSYNIDAVLKKHMDAKAEQFAKEMKARYDNIFAARVVSALKEQKLLAPDVAKMLLGEDE